MNTVAVLLLTIFFSNGGSTAQAVMAPDLEQCETAKPFIVQNVIDNIVKAGGLTIEGEKVTVTYIDGFCHLAKEGARA